jgi:hypothetical protein
MFSTAGHWPPPKIGWAQSRTSHPVSLATIIILSCHLRCCSLNTFYSATQTLGQASVGETPLTLHHIRRTWSPRCRFTTSQLNKSDMSTCKAICGEEKCGTQKWRHGGVSESSGWCSYFLFGRFQLKSWPRDQYPVWSFRGFPQSSYALTPN